MYLFVPFFMSVDVEVSGPQARKRQPKSGFPISANLPGLRPAGLKKVLLLIVKHGLKSIRFYKIKRLRRKSRSRLTIKSGSGGSLFKR